MSRTHTTPQPPMGESLQLLTTLASDVGALMTIRGSLPPGVAERLVVRNLFALVDAFAFYLKITALAVSNSGKIEFSEKELKLLREGHEVDRDGEMIWTPYLPGVKENLRGAIRLYAKARGRKTPLAGELPMPPDFDAAVGIRTRVIHPKVLRDLEIGDADKATINNLLRWFLKMSQWVTEEEVAHLRRMREEINDSIEAQKRGILERAPWNPDAPGS